MNGGFVTDDSRQQVSAIPDGRTNCQSISYLQCVIDTGSYA